MQPSAREEKGSHQEPAMMVPWSWDMAAFTAVRHKCLWFNLPNLWYFVTAAWTKSRVETRSLGISDSSQGLLIVEDLVCLRMWVVSALHSIQIQIRQGGWEHKKTDSDILCAIFLPAQLKSCIHRVGWEAEPFKVHDHAFVLLPLGDMHLKHKI